MLLREPVDRVVSQFHYLRNATWEPTFGQLPATLAEYADSSTLETHWMTLALTLPRAQDRVSNPGPFNEAAARIPVQALVILTLGRTLTSSLPAHPGEPSLL